MATLVPLTVSVPVACLETLTTLGAKPKSAIVVAEGPRRTCSPILQPTPTPPSLGMDEIVDATLTTTVVAIPPIRKRTLVPRTVTVIAPRTLEVP